ncbi:protein of unknown function (DUF4082) [Parafrankia irregularis]|uniref:DUF4082 domain-containing protein n=2 Tax=Frankiaceae TaxID=74712 RepID=A0A0S4QSB4_9ACTN|nr:protein of unknown function (DUF4082) [Parafrankia irregularis]
MTASNTWSEFHVSAEMADRAEAGPVTGIPVPDGTATGADLAGFNPAGHDLTGAGVAGFGTAGHDLAGADLTGAEMAAFGTAGHDLAGADLAGFDPTGFGTAGHELADHGLAGADVAGFYPDGYELADYEAAGFDPAGYDLADHDLAEHDLTGADLAGPDPADFDPADFDPADLEPAGPASTASGRQGGARPPGRGGRRRRQRGAAQPRPARRPSRRLSIMLVVALAGGLVGLVVGLRTASDNLTVAEAGRSGRGSSGPVSLWNGRGALTVETSPDTRQVVLGLRFRPEVSGRISALRVYRPTAGGGPNTGALWSGDGRQLSTLTIPNSDQAGWRRGAFERPVAVQAGQTYVAAYQVDSGGYVDQVDYFGAGKVRKVGPLIALAGVYTYRAAAFPDETWRDSNYYVDVEFQPVTSGAGAPVTVPPSPGPNATAPASPGVSAGPSAGATPGATTTASATPTGQAPTPAGGGATVPQATPQTSGVSAPPSAWPGPDSTGVKPGVALTPSGSITVTKDNTVISGLDITGTITVRAKNVTIRNVRVHGCGDRGAIDAGYVEDRVGPTLVEDVEVSGDGLACDRTGVGNSNMTIRRADIHGFRAGIYSDGNTVVENSWVHDLYSNHSSHMDGFLSNGGSNFTLVGNNIECAVPDGNDMCSGSVGLFGDFAPIQNVLIRYNLFNTQGAYCVYGGSGAQKAFPLASNVRILDNTFGRRYHPTCGTYGTIAGFESVNGNQVSGNVWVDTGAAVTP